MSQKLILTSQGQSNTSDYTTHYPHNINLNGIQHEVALTRIDTYFSYYNISAALGNNTFQYNNGSDDVVLTIDDGTYSMETLIDEIHDEMIDAMDYTDVDGENVFDINFSLDLSSGYVTMILTNGFSVDFTDRNIRTIFGFNSSNYDTTSISESTADINYGVTKVLVHCSLCSGSSWINGNPSDVIYSFSVNQQPNEELIIEPNPIYVNLNTKSPISNIRMYLTDQLGRALDFHGSPVSYELHITPVTRY